MRRALELITAQVTAPGAAFTAMSALSGNSFVIRNTTKPVRLLAAWQQRQSPGATRITSPLLHDNVRGVQYGSGIACDDGIVNSPLQSLYSQDTLSFAGTGSAVAGDIEQSSILIAYDDLPGVDGIFLTAAQVNAKAVNRLGVLTTLAQTLVTGQYDGEQTIVADEDVLKANTFYAVLGCTTLGGAVTSLRIRSPDWGNLGIGMPGPLLQNFRMSDWFYRLALRTGQAVIPVFNSANKATTLVDYCDNETSTGINAYWQLVELKGNLS